MQEAGWVNDVSVIKQIKDYKNSRLSLFTPFRIIAKFIVKGFTTFFILPYHKAS